jgi:hypothetical protein
MSGSPWSASGCLPLAEPVLHSPRVAASAGISQGLALAASDRRPLSALANMPPPSFHIINIAKFHGGDK